MTLHLKKDIRSCKHFELLSALTSVLALSVDCKIQLKSPTINKLLSFKAYCDIQDFNRLKKSILFFSSFGAYILTIVIMLSSTLILTKRRLPSIVL